jgi:hypothetical protein
MQKSTLSTFLRTVGLTSILAIGIVSSGQVNAASQCKGLDNAACDTAAACGWVDGYERKDGRKVSAFCRSKPKSVTSKAPAKPADPKTSN